MNYYIAQNPSREPIESVELPEISGAETAGSILLVPIIWFVLNKAWELAQPWVNSKLKISEKREDSETESMQRILQSSVENKERLLSQVQEHSNKLLDEVIGSNQEAMQNLTSSVTSIAQIQASMMETMKLQADVSANNSNQILDILGRIDGMTNRSVNEAFSTQARMYAANSKTLTEMSEKLVLITSGVEALHERFDAQYGRRNQHA